MILVSSSRLRSVLTSASIPRLPKISSASRLSLSATSTFGAIVFLLLRRNRARHHPSPEARARPFHPMWAMWDLTITIQSPEDEIAVRRVYEARQQRCPVYLALTKALSVATTLEIART